VEGVGVGAQSIGESTQKGVVRRIRQSERQQKAGGIGAFRREIGQVHAQRLARDVARPIVDKKMDAGHDGVLGQDEIAVGRRRQRSSVIFQRKGAGMMGKRTKIVRDQPVFPRLVMVAGHGQTAGRLNSSGRKCRAR